MGNAASYCRAMKVPPGSLGRSWPICVYTVAAINRPLVLNGRLDDPQWQQAPPAGDFTLMAADGSRSRHTGRLSAYFMMIDFLYIGVICDEPAAAELNPPPETQVMQRQSFGAKLSKSSWTRAIRTICTITLRSVPPAVATMPAVWMPPGTAMRP